MRRREIASGRRLETCKYVRAGEGEESEENLCWELKPVGSVSFQARELVPKTAFDGLHSELDFRESLCEGVCVRLLFVLLRGGG
jgi:hypothetical protein